MSKANHPYGCCGEAGGGGTAVVQAYPVSCLRLINKPVPPSVKEIAWQLSLHVQKGHGDNQSTWGHRGTSLIRNTPLLGPYSGTISRVIWRFKRGGRFLMSEVPLYPASCRRGQLSHGRACRWAMLGEIET